MTIVLTEKEIQEAIGYIDEINYYESEMGFEIVNLESLEGIEFEIEGE